MRGAKKREGVDGVDRRVREYWWGCMNRQWGQREKKRSKRGEGRGDSVVTGEEEEDICRGGRRRNMDGGNDK